MATCTNCGASLKPEDQTCAVCGVVTPSYRTQRLCQNCGAHAAQDAKTCMMCGHEIDAIPGRATPFSSSISGFIVGLAVIGVLVYGFFRLQTVPAPSLAVTAPTSTTPTENFVPPTETPGPSLTATPSPPPTLTATPMPPTSTPTPTIHTIRAGETLLFIASQYNITVEEITQANNITEETILSVGQELVIPVSTFSLANGGVQEVRQQPIITYVVESGDTLSGIAFEYDISMATIQQANPGIDLDLLYIGQEIQVPLSAPTLTPTPSVTPTPTFTPRALAFAPNLLQPIDHSLIEGDDSSVLLSWTAVQLLDDNTFYVITLTDDSGDLTTYWTQDSSYRLPPEDRPSALTQYQWNVTVMEQLGVDEDGIFYGNARSETSETRSFSWR